MKARRATLNAEVGAAIARRRGARTARCRAGVS